MLKIKDSVDLKELEKFGFKRVEFRKMFSDYVRSYQFESKNISNLSNKLIQIDTLIIHDKNSVMNKGDIQIIIEDLIKIDVFGTRIYGLGDEIQNKLFDLFQADLIEKVEE